MLCGKLSSQPRILNIEHDLSAFGKGIFLLWFTHKYHCFFLIVCNSSIVVMCALSGIIFDFNGKYGRK